MTIALRIFDTYYLWSNNLYTGRVKWMKIISFKYHNWGHYYVFDMYITHLLSRTICVLWSGKLWKIGMWLLTFSIWPRFLGATCLSFTRSPTGVAFLKTFLKHIGSFTPLLFLHHKLLFCIKNWVILQTFLVFVSLFVH